MLNDSLNMAQMSFCVYWRSKQNPETPQKDKQKTFGKFSQYFDYVAVVLWEYDSDLGPDNKRLYTMSFAARLVMYMQITQAVKDFELKT